MKKYALLIGACALAATAGAQMLDRSIRPKAGPAPKIELGKTEEFTLPNGLRVFVVENHKLPTIAVSIQLDIRPELQGDAAGYEDLVGDLLTCGTKTRDNDHLNASIDNIGASMRATEESLYASSLKKHETMLLDLMSDIAINSDFKQTELDKQRKEEMSGLATTKNNPDAMLANVTKAVNYGPNHRYGEVMTEATMDKATLEKCRSYYSTYWRPNVAYMAIVGDVTLAEVKPLIEKYFSKWQKADVPRATYTVPEPGRNVHVALANRDAAVQSVFNITYPIRLEPGTPDVVKARVANAVLGGGSQGRLFLDLREAHGWTYGSYSSIKEDELVGNFTANAKCRNAVTDSAIAAALAEMRRMRDEPVTQEELQNRITYMTGNFAINLENPQTVAQYAINIERYHMPKNYYTDYLKNLSAVTAADVQEMSRKYITPENANIVLVGNSGEVAKKLEQFGKIDNYDNYGRPAAAIVQAAVPSGVTADAVYKKYVDAIGGEKAISGLKDIKTVRTAEFNGMTLTLTEMKKSPGMMKQTTDVAQMGTVRKMVVAGGKGYSESQGQKSDMKEEELATFMPQADLQSPLHPDKYGMKRTITGMEKVGDNNAYVVQTTDAKGQKTTEYYDAMSGLLLKQTGTRTTPQGDMSVTTEFSDYKEVPGTNGYKVPYRVKANFGPQTFDASTQSVEVNKGISDSEFK